VRTANVESFVASIYDLPSVETNKLAYLNDVALYMDMTSKPAIGGVVEATFKVSGAYKRSDTVAYLVTPNGYTITLDATARTGTVSIDGVDYPVLEEAPEATATGGRRLETSDDTPVVPLYSGRQVFERQISSRRQLARRAAFLSTSGSFTLSSGGANSGGNSRRQLARRGAFLSRSGSFTLSSGGGGMANMAGND
jgi:hypothetical protein